MPIGAGIRRQWQHTSVLLPLVEGGSLGGFMLSTKRSSRRMASKGTEGEAVNIWGPCRTAGHLYQVVSRVQCDGERDLGCYRREPCHRLTVHNHLQPPVVGWQAVDSHLIATALI